MDNFPINSQTSDSDKEVLLKIRSLLGPKYSYLEIGSYLGGSLTPFLRDENCIKILSIDNRGQKQPDERGAKFDYSGITHTTSFNEFPKKKTILWGQGALMIFQKKKPSRAILWG